MGEIKIKFLNSENWKEERGFFLLKAYWLLLVQKIIYFYWKRFEKRTCKCWDGSHPNGFTFRKISCPIVYLKKRGRDSIAIGLFFSFNKKMLKKQ